MNVTEVMTHAVFACRPDDTLEAAARTLWDRDCGCAPVVDAEGRLVAMITDRDICMASYLQGRPLAQMKVSSAASHGVVAAREDQTVEQVEALMRQHRVRRVPVVDAAGRPVGVVSMNDLARRSHLGGRRHDGLGAESVVGTLAAICEPPAAPARAAE